MRGTGKRMEATFNRRVDRRSVIAAVAVCACTIIGAAFRLCGIGWELPGKLHKFTYHPDEIFQVGSIINLNPFALKLDPGFFNYPSGYMNLASAVMRLAEAYGMKIDDASVYLIARLVTASLGILTIPVIYLLGRRLFGFAVGLIACLIYAIMPLCIVHSHFATVDVPSAFWTTCAILAAAAILSKPTTKNCIIAGLAAGIAAGTKYNCALVLLSVLTAIVISKRNNPKGNVVLSVVISIIGTIIGLLVASPGILIWPNKYVSGFLYELGHAAAGHGLVFAGRGPGWLDVLSSAFGFGLGVPILAASLLAVALAITRHRREDWMILAFAVPYFMLIAFSQVRFTRYAIPLMPPVAVLIARLMIEIYELLHHQRVRIAKVGWALCSIGIIVYTILYAAALTKLFTMPDPRNQAFKWLKEDAPPSTSVGLATVPWFYSPPYTPEINGLPSAWDRYKEMSKSPWRLVIGTGENKGNLPSWQASVPATDRPMYIIISDYEYEDALRIREPNALEFMRQVAANYTEKTIFAPRLQFIGLDFGAAEQLPHDLKYMAPTIHIYQRRR